MKILTTVLLFSLLVIASGCGRDNEATKSAKAVVDLLRQIETDAMNGLPVVDLRRKLAAAHTEFGRVQDINDLENPIVMGHLYNALLAYRFALEDYNRYQDEYESDTAYKERLANRLAYVRELLSNATTDREKAAELLGM